MTTVQQLVTWLQEFPQDATVILQGANPWATPWPLQIQRINGTVLISEDESDEN